MNTHTPAWIRRRGLTLTPLGELIYIAAAALVGILWILIMVIGCAALFTLVGGA